MLGSLGIPSSWCLQSFDLFGLFKFGMGTQKYKNVLASGYLFCEKIHKCGQLSKSQPQLPVMTPSTLGNSSQTKSVPKMNS